MLPPRSATVATKTPAATAMAGAQTTINNQLKAATATATATAMMAVTTITMKTKATVVVAAAAARQQCKGGSNGSSATARGHFKGIPRQACPQQGPKFRRRGRMDGDSWSGTAPSMMHQCFCTCSWRRKQPPTCRILRG